jgi:hypothetical protein
VQHPRIFDQQGQEQDWDWLVAHFGAVDLRRAPATQGYAHRIVKLQDAEGSAIQVVNVRSHDGHPIEGVRVVRSWPDAPSLPAWAPPASTWRSQGVYGQTNGNGDIGYGMGHGEYYDPPNAGPGAVWVADPSGPSDLISGLGMLANSDHRHLDIYFQLQPAGAPSVGAAAQPAAEPATVPPVVPAAVPPVETVAVPPAEPAAAPPEVPVEERWQRLFAKLDQIIAMLEDLAPPE